MDKKIRNNIIWFFVSAVVCLLALVLVSKADIDEFVRLLAAVSIVCGFFVAGSLFAVRIFYLCFKNPK